MAGEDIKGWLTLPIADAAELEPIQDAASIYANNFTEKVERQTG